MKQYDYDWDEYLKWQLEANQRKRHMVWVSRRNIEFLCDYLGDSVSSILCHGTRRGKEQQWFKARYPNALVMGTEISPSATDFPMTIEHDFHNPTGMLVDVIYSNSLDHAFDPYRALKVWHSEADRVLIEHSDGDFDDRVTKFDPFGASFDELRQLISRYGRVLDVLDLPEKHVGIREQRVFVSSAFVKGRSTVPNM